jgi:deoxyribodipyrimidine photo-lyase
VDELRRDIATVRLGREKGVGVQCVHDRLVAPPGRITSQAGKPMSVFRYVHSSFQRAVADEQSLAEGFVFTH